MRFLLPLVVVLLGFASVRPGPAVAAGGEIPTEEANARFTYKGKPIHPGCIREFEVWMSDGDPPRVLTVDVDSCVTSDKNFSPLRRSPDGWVSASTGDEQSRDWCAYKHLGRTSTGTHVLAVRLAGGGTMVATYVYLVRFDQEEYQLFSKGGERPSVEKRLVLKCVGQLGIGDRDDGTLELRGDVLVLGVSRHRNQEEKYRLP